MLPYIINIYGDALTLTGFVVLAEGLYMFRQRVVAVGGKGLSSGNLPLAKRTSVEQMSGG
jgi:hypothetical protein